MALYQDKIRMVAALPQMRYNPPTLNISQSVDRAIAREDAYNKIALAEQSQREREARLNKEFDRRFVAQNAENEKRIAASNIESDRRAGRDFGYQSKQKEIADFYNTRLADRQHKQYMDRENLRGLLDIKKEGRTQDNKAFEQVLKYQAQYGDANPISGLSPSQQMAWDAATKQGKVNADRRRGADMYAAGLMGKVMNYSAGSVLQDATMKLMDQAAPREVLELWYKENYSKLGDELNSAISAQGSSLGSGLPPNQMMPDNGTAGYDMLRRAYLEKSGQMGPIEEQAKLAASAAEMRHQQDQDMLKLMLQSNASPFEYIGRVPMSMDASRDESQPAPTLSQGIQAIDLSGLDDQKPNPLGKVAQVGFGGLGAYSAARPSLATGKFITNQMSKNLAEATKSEFNKLKNFPAGPYNKGEAMLEQIPKTINSEIDSLTKTQKNILSANGIDVEGKNNRQILDIFEKAVKDGKIKRVPSADKAVLKKLSKGALGSVWKRALGAVVGPTAVGSNAGPWGSVAGFAFGLGMAAWTAYDLLNLGKELTSDE